MPERKTLLLLEDMLDSAEKIISYTYDKSFKDFIEDDRTMDAVIRNFEIIGAGVPLSPVTIIIVFSAIPRRFTLLKIFPISLSMYLTMEGKNTESSILLSGFQAANSGSSGVGEKGG